MRQRFRPFRARAMARRPGEEGRIALGPRERRLLGWIVAIVLVIGIAIVVGILGGNGDGAPVDPGQSPSPSAGSALQITFGTALDRSTGQVAETARTDRFAAGDTFAYSVEPMASLPSSIFVEVTRTAGGPPEIVQGPESPSGWEQPIASGAPTIAFSPPAEYLIDAFGPGEYRMRIFIDPEGAPIAEGSFTLLGATLSSGAPSASP